MRKKWEQLKTRYPFLKWIGNRYFLVGLFFLIWMIFLDDYSYLEHRSVNKEIKELENNRNYYKREKEKDEEEIIWLRQPDYIEKYAREKYYMKRPDEDIFIIEYEEEQEPEELSKSL